MSETTTETTSPKRTKASNAAHPTSVVTSMFEWSSIRHQAALTDREG
jgi:hypothetical protein